jgi:hypothetical protein
MRVKTALTEAIDQVALENKSKQFRDNITDRDALDYVDHDVIVAWVAQELSLRNPQQLLSDIFENLTDADATSVLNCLNNETDTARRILAPCMRQYVAKDVAYAAQLLLDHYDPTDAEVERNNESLMDMARSERNA